MKKNLLWSIVGLLGVTLASCSGTDSADSAYVSVQLEDSQMWSLLDVANGEIVMNDEFFAPSSGVVNGSFFVESDNGKFDLYNLKDTKNKLNRSSFSTVTNFSPEGYAIVRVEDEPWQIISTDGTVVATLDKSLSVLSGFSNEGLAQIANKDGMVGYVNTKGETPIKPRYKVGTIFSDGIAFVLTKQEGDHNYFSAINPAGESVFTFSDAKYSEIGLYNEGHAFAVEGDHSVLLDKTGKKVMTVCQGTNIGNLSYSKGNIIYYDGQFYGVKSTEDKILIRAKYQRLKFQSDGKLIAVNNNGKYGVITVEDEIETPFDYDVLEYLAPGRYITKSGNVNVLIDSKGKEVCDKAFASYSNRSSSASENNLTSLISADNNKSFESEFSNEDSSWGSALNLMNLGDWTSESSSFGGSGSSGDFDLGYVHMGKNEGLVDGKYKIIMEVTSVDGNVIKGHTYYPSVIEKYGDSPKAYMPFTGEFGIGDMAYFSLTVASPTDSSYEENWFVNDVGGYMMGTISASNGKSMTVVFQ